MEEQEQGRMRVTFKDKAAKIFKSISPLNPNRGKIFHLEVTKLLLEERANKIHLEVIFLDLDINCLKNRG